MFQVFCNMVPLFNTEVHSRELPEWVFPSCLWSSLAAPPPSVHMIPLVVHRPSARLAACPAHLRVTTELNIRER